MPVYAADRLLKLFGTQILFHCLSDGLTFEILGRKTTFFDTRSKKTLQYGVSIQLKNGKQFTYLGDEPYRPDCADYAAQVDYLMHEAMCLESQEEQYHPHRIQHSTVKDTAQCAAQLQVGSLILHHTEDKNLAQRKAAYTAEAQQHLPVPCMFPMIWKPLCCRFGLCKHCFCHIAVNGVYPCGTPFLSAKTKLFSLTAVDSGNAENRKNSRQIFLPGRQNAVLFKKLVTCYNISYE